MIFSDLFLYKFIITTVVVIALSFIAEYISPKWAGIISGFPTGTPIILYFYALENGLKFAGESAIYNMVGLVAMQMFLFCYPDFLDDGITSEFNQAGYKSHMKLHDATGLDQPYGAKRGSMHVPSNIKALFMYMSDEEVPHALSIVRRLKEKYPNERLRMLTWALKECY